MSPMLRLSKRAQTLTVFSLVLRLPDSQQMFAEA